MTLAAPVSAPERARPPLARRRREALTGALFAAPAQLVIVLVFALPLVLAGWMSVNDWPLLGRPEFVGGANYTAIGSNELFLRSIWFTLLYTVVVSSAYFVIGLGLALLVQQKGRLVAFYRTAYFLPTAVGLSAAALTFYVLYNNEFGPFDDVLRVLGLADGEVNFLTDPRSAFFSTVLLVIWRFAGFTMIILLTGLQSIPADVYEAARIDGAGPWRTLVSITLPLLKPVIAIVMILNVTGSLLAFEPFYVLTTGGPSNSTVTMVIAMFREAFTLGNLGAASAIALVLVLALLLLNAAQLGVLGRRERP